MPGSTISPAVTYARKTYTVALSVEVDYLLCCGVFLLRITSYISNMSNNDLERFIESQNSPCNGYKQALPEIRDGRKRSHWVWYIFPQLRGLGFSYQANFYGIADREEAARYLRHPVLGTRLREITHALLQHRDTPPESILGGIDALKVCSCMTLFDAISPNDLFSEVLAAFYAHDRCERTLEMLGEG